MTSNEPDLVNSAEFVGCDAPECDRGQPYYVIRADSRRPSPVCEYHLKHAAGVSS